jgi:hypothetical protein
MLEGEVIYSANKMYYVTLQTDGNIVVYTVATGKARWNSGTYNKGTIGTRTLNMQGDGNLVLYNGAQALWSIGKNSAAAPFVATMQNDGNFVVYDVNGKALWACC